MHIGILKSGQSPESLRGEHGDYDSMFEQLLGGRGFEFTSWHVEAMEFPDSIRAADGWLLTGSRHGVYEKHDFIPPLEDFIRQVYLAGIPMVGICFGHQIIAQALGGTVIQNPNGWAVGAQDYDFGGLRITLNAWHQDQIVKLPPDARVAGQNAFCKYAALTYGDRAFTIQAHPEFNDSFIHGLLTQRGPGMVPDELIRRAEDRMGSDRQSLNVADRIETFFKLPRAASQRGAA